MINSSTDILCRALNIAMESITQGRDPIARKLTSQHKGITSNKDWGLEQRKRTRAHKGIEALHVIQTKPNIVPRERECLLRQMKKAFKYSPQNTKDDLKKSPNASSG